MIDPRLHNEQGWLLASTLIMLTTLATIAFAMGMYVYYEIYTESRYEARERARYIAEAGLATYLHEYWIKNPAKKRTSNSMDDFAGGKYTIVKVAADTLLVIGEFDNQKTEIVVAVLQSGAGWDYGLMAGEEIEMEHDAEGQIIGNVHANDEVERSSRLFVQGSVTEGKPEVQPPAIDWDFFKQQARKTGQFVNGKKTFDERGSPYSGVWYVAGEAKIKDHVVFSGVLVSEKKIKIDGDEIILQPAKTGQPVLLCKEKVELKGDELTIKGFVYAGKELKFKGDTITLVGSACSRKKIELKGDELKIRFNSAYVSNLQGVTFSGHGGGKDIKIVHWKEN
ncbi:MAG: hypothetical protein Q9P14_00180 [candidate division KSB1 bacterium]|nr:hypothetical protein [candidate division KSB1 bacterium]MDQ7062857.1 hypothetical protein [candidate division KSB1 bacterium]